MFVYFDKTGTLREIINDEAIRQGNMNAEDLPAYVNAIYAYFEGQEGATAVSCWAVFAKPDGSLTTERQYSETATKQIPYDRKRPLKCFKYFTDYEFRVVPMPNEILAESGTCAATIRLVLSTGGEKSLLALGKIPFVVEDEVVKSDNLITQSQYNYLISLGGATYYVPHIDKEAGTMYWTNNGGLENPEPVTIADSLGTGNVKTPNIADGAVTPAKLDRAYLPLSGGTMAGVLDTSYPIIERGHFELTPEGDALFAGTSTFTGDAQMNGAVTFAGEGDFDTYKDSYFRGTVYLGDVKALASSQGKISFLDPMEVYEVSAGGNSMRPTGITATSIRSYPGALPISAAGLTYVVGGQLYTGGPAMAPGILATDAYLMGKISEEDERISKIYLPMLTPEAPGDYAYISSLNQGGTKSNGLLKVSQDASPSTLARYDDDGRLAVNGPEERGQAANKGYVDDLVSSLKSGTFENVETLPKTGEPGVIYLVPDGAGNKEQWIWQDGAWVSLGDTSFQADDYYTKEQADGLLNGKLSSSAGAVKPANLDPTGDYSVNTLKLNGGDLYSSEGTRYHLRPDIGGEIATTDDLGVNDGEVTTRKIADYAVTADKIADGAVTADKIMAANVNGDKIADNAVWNNHIQNGAVSKTKLDEALQSEIDGKVGYSEASEASSLIKAPAFLSLGDARFLKQSAVPKLRSYELSIAASALKGKFGLGSYAPQGTEQCLIYYGDDPSPMTLATVSLGEDGNWVVKPSQTLASGTEVSCGDLLYKVTQGICKAGVFQTNIWDCVKPIGCRFDLYATLPGDTVFNSMDNVDLNVKMASSTNQRFNIQIKGTHNSSIYVDSSEYHPVVADTPEVESFQFQLYNDNYGAILGLNMLAETAKARGDSITKMSVSVAGKGDYTFPRLLYYSTTNIAADGCTNYWFVTRDKPAYNPALGQIVQMDYRFEFSESGLTTFMPVPHMVDYEPEAEPTAVKARAMSMQAEPVEPNVPEGAVGIFSVDGDGNTINAMTGRKLNA